MLSEPDLYAIPGICRDRALAHDPDTTGIGMAEDIEIRIEQPDMHGVGEIVVRHPNMFLGYYKNPQASVVDMRDGWLHSGDAGYFNDSSLLVSFSKAASEIVNET